jgi:hypothetical protein
MDLRQLLDEWEAESAPNRPQSRVVATRERRLVEASDDVLATLSELALLIDERDSADDETRRSALTAAIERAAAHLVDGARREQTAGAAAGRLDSTINDIAGERNSGRGVAVNERTVTLLHRAEAALARSLGVRERSDHASQHARAVHDTLDTAGAGHPTGGRPPR